MKNKIHSAKNRWIFIVLAVLYVSSSVWLLGGRLIMNFLGKYTVAEIVTGFTVFNNAFTAALFTLVIAAFFYALRSFAAGRPRAAFTFIAAARTASFALYLLGLIFGTSDRMFLLNITLGSVAGLLECAAFYLIGSVSQSYQEARYVSYATAAILLINAAAAAVKTYAGMMIFGAGELTLWLKILSYTGSAQFITSIAAGVTAGLVFILLRLESGKSTDGEQNENTDCS